jgi:hypothetical protein
MTQAIKAEITPKPNLENPNFPSRKTKSTNGTYRMPGAIKTLLASEIDTKAQALFKRMLIDGQSYAQDMALQLAKKREKKAV